MLQKAAAYSFADVTATLASPAGIVRLGAGEAVADEGITVEKAEDQNTMMVGCNGEVMHCKHAGNNGIIRVRLLRTSSTNGQLMNVLNSLKGDEWGLCNFGMRDRWNGDSLIAAEVAFTGPPAGLSYGKIAGISEWIFHAGHLDILLYAGSSVVT